MKRDLVHLLCCPDCKGDLSLVDETPVVTAGPADAAPADVEQGQLVCGSCRQGFPILRGVPRFVSSDQYVGSFSYEWNRWNRVQLDVHNGRSESEDAFLQKTAFTPADLDGKLVLDVGCGAGRFLDVASRWGAHVIGVDLSFAVEASQKNVGHRPHVSVIQADVFRLPFRSGTFDAIFSIGVLHHSRDTREAFLQLPALLKEGGDLAVWLYYYQDRLYNAASDFWRAVLRPFGTRGIYAWCWTIVTLFSWLFMRRGIWRSPWNVLPRILPLNTHPDKQWRILDTFDWYSPRYQDKACSPERVIAWCAEGSIHDVRVLEFPTSIRGRRDGAGALPLLRRPLAAATVVSAPPAVAPVAVGITSTPSMPPPLHRAGKPRTIGDMDAPRVLVVRCCRPAQFARAVALARERRPDARIYGLSVAGHAEAVISGGADEVIEVSGAALNVFRLSPSTLTQLRSLRCDEIVIPQMTPSLAGHLNVYGVAAAAGARRYVVIPGDQPPMELRPAAFRKLLRQAVVDRWDTPMFIATVAVTSVRSIVRRLVTGRSRVDAGTGRRRVAHIIGSLGTGGAQVQMAELINRTPAEAYDVTVLVLDGSDGSPLRRLIARDDVRVIIMPPAQSRCGALRQMTERCRAERYDLVHTWMLGSNVLGTTAARRAGVPRVITSVRSMTKSHEWWYREWWWRTLDGFISRAADIVTVNARALVEDHARWARLPQSRIEVVNNGLDPSTLRGDRTAARKRLSELAGLAPHAVVIGTVGRLAEEKGHALFLRMLARARAWRPDLHGVIVGGGEDRASLEQLAERLEVAEAVTFLGDRSDARALVAGFDVFVLPSMTEGFPNALLEAVFIGVPALATDVGGNLEVLGDPALLIPPADGHGAARVLLDLLADGTRMAGRASAARDRALESFTSQHSVSRWLRLYDRCFDTPGETAVLHPARATGDC